MLLRRSVRAESASRVFTLEAGFEGCSDCVGRRPVRPLHYVYGSAWHDPGASYAERMKTVALRGRCSKSHKALTPP